MADIFHDFPIYARADRVFTALSTPDGLDKWWTKSSSGEAKPGAEIGLFFGPEHQWRARVTRHVPGSEFEIEMTVADNDWLGTRVGFQLETQGDSTKVRFRHTGWPVENTHWRVSTYCWAMYLRLLRRYIESAEVVPYEKRLDV